MFAWHLLELYHIDPLFVFATIDLDPQVMYEENGTYPYGKVLDLWDEMARVIPDPQFGLKAGECWHPAFYGNLGYAAIMGSSIRSSLETIIKYESTIANQSRIQLIEDFDAHTLKLSFATEDKRPGTVGREDSLLAIFRTWLQFISVKKIHFIEVNINHEAPENPSKYFELFKSPVNFDAGETSLVINSEAADHVLPLGPQSLTDFNEKEMRNYAIQKKNATVAYRIMLYIEKNLEEGQIQVDNVANHFNVTPKTLQRILKKEGDSFSSILDRTRERLADTYIQHDKDMSEITYLLGFSEQSAFSRWFKKIKGCSPSEYRDRKIKKALPDRRIR